MDFNKLFRSQALKNALIIIGVLIILVSIFKVGIFVGYRKAQFSYRWGENYHRNFGGPKGGFMSDLRRGFGDKDFVNAHGTFGSILKVDGATILVKGQDDAEKAVLVSSSTMVRKGHEIIQSIDLKPDDEIVVIGSPNDQGQIEAKLIRVFSEDGMKLPVRSHFKGFF